MLIIKIVIDQLIEDTPIEIVEAERERKAINQRYEEFGCSHVGKPDQGGSNVEDNDKTMGFLQNTGANITLSNFMTVRPSNEADEMDEQRGCFV